MSLKVNSGNLNSQRLFEIAVVRTLNQLQPDLLPQNKLFEHFYYNFTEQQLLSRRLKVFDVSKEDVIKVAEKYIYKAMLEDKSSKVIFGPKSANLEGLVSRGWRVEKYFTDISLNSGSQGLHLGESVEKIKKYH